MARRVGAERRASPLFATIGPSPATVRRLGGDPEQVLAAWRAWRDKHLEAWERNEPGTPEPPGAGQFDAFARPAAWRVA